MSEEVPPSIEDFIVEGKDISSIEMGCDKVQLSCTTGKIKVWFGRQTSSDLVHKVLCSFSDVDSSFIHEKEMICDFDQIPFYESNEYTLISYGRTNGGYRAIFNIQFSKQKALNHFIKAIIKELEESDVNKTFHWNGSIARIVLIYNELKSLDDWNILKIEYREEE